ncbi:protein of unknown function [Pseudomonas mediterranea]
MAKGFSVTKKFICGKEVICGEGIYPRRAAEQPHHYGLNPSDSPSCLVLGLLRSPAGINPLATDKSPRHRQAIKKGHPKAALKKLERFFAYTAATGRM